MEPGKRNSDSGWNDPPNFSYSESLMHTNSPKRNLLNKRVAYPMNRSTVTDPSSIDPTSMPNFNPNLPPPPAAPSKDFTSTSDCNPNLPPPVTTVMSKNTSLPETSPVIVDIQCDSKTCDSAKIDEEKSESMLKEVLDHINQVMEKKNELLQGQNKCENVKKKLHNMEEAWKSKLTDDIKQKILHLSKALNEEDKNIANDIQASLMVDYPKLCSEFISAFRLLINIE